MWVRVGEAAQQLGDLSVLLLVFLCCLVGGGKCEGAETCLWSWDKYRQSHGVGLPFLLPYLPRALEGICYNLQLANQPASQLALGTY